jgi:ATP-dependent protease ClpP protease subunit
MKIKEVYIYGVIGEHVTLSSVKSQIGQEKYDRLDVYIDSVGGYTDDGFAIYDYLKSLAGKVRTIGEGRIFSMASVVFMAGKERLLRPNAKLMIHLPWATVEGNSEDLKQYAAFLERENARCLNVYEKNVSMPRQKIEQMLKNETYLTAEEAINMGFATGITESYKAVALIRNIKNNYKMSIIEKVRAALAVLNWFEAKSMIVSVEDGPELFVFTEDGTLVNKSVVVAEDGNPTETPAPDGVHQLSTGEIITIEKGVIVSVVEASSGMEQENYEALAKKTDALAKQFAAFRSELAESIDLLTTAIASVAAQKTSTHDVGQRKMTYSNAKANTSKPISGIESLKIVKAKREANAKK